MKFLIFFFCLFSIVYSIPCPSQCICKSLDSEDNDDIDQITYLMDCSNQSFPDGKLIYQAENWSIDQIHIDTTNSYSLSIDFSKSLSTKTFTSDTIQLTGFSYSIECLSLTNQEKNFALTINSFNSPIYSNIKFLNLSTCCHQIPENCASIFRPLKQLQILDLSHSDMYKTCLQTTESIFSELTDLILQDNHFEINIFSNKNKILENVRNIPGKLDLQHSIINQENSQDKVCLFTKFQEIKTLDISSIRFQSNTSELSSLFECNFELNPSEQILKLYLRHLHLEQLPEWLTEKNFPRLRQLDLSSNKIRSIDLVKFDSLRSIFLSHNPIEFNKIKWRDDKLYTSIDLHSITHKQSYNLTNRLANLFNLTGNIDYSNNQGNTSIVLTNIPFVNDGTLSKLSLTISGLNIRSFMGSYPDLEYLDISWNQLKELNIEQSMKLSYLDCSNQQLEKIIFNEKLTDLTEFYCSNNSLQTIDNFSQLILRQLKYIDLSRNSIRSIENLLSNLNSRFLRRISLQFNSIDIIPTKIFHRGLVSLYEINLSYNRIKTIQTEAFHAPNLQILDLRGNPLKIIEPNAIFTASLRLFYVYNSTEHLINRCSQSKSDEILSFYIDWFRTNGTLMDNDRIEFNKCFNRTKTESKVKLVLKKTKHFFGYYFLQFLGSLIIIGFIVGLVYHYRKHQIKFFSKFRRYKKLDRQNLVDNELEVDRQDIEDDNIVMNLKEAPYTQLQTFSSTV